MSESRKIPNRQSRIINSSMPVGMRIVINVISETVDVMNQALAVVKKGEDIVTEGVNTIKNVVNVIEQGVFKLIKNRLKYFYNYVSNLLLNIFKKTI